MLSFRACFQGIDNFGCCFCCCYFVLKPLLPLLLLSLVMYNAILIIAKFSIISIIVIIYFIIMPQKAIKNFRKVRFFIHFYVIFFCLALSFGWALFAAAVDNMSTAKSVLTAFIFAFFFCASLKANLSQQQIWLHIFGLPHLGMYMRIKKYFNLYLPRLMLCLDADSVDELKALAKEFFVKPLLKNFWA